MAVYSGEDGEIRFERNALSADVSQLFKACGMSKSDADVVADILVHADLRGNWIST